MTLPLSTHWPRQLLALWVIVFVLFSAVPVSADSLKECVKDFHDDGEWESDCPGAGVVKWIKHAIFFLHSSPTVAFAPGDYDAEPTFIELRSDTGNNWGTNITGSSGDDIDIRMNVFLGLRNNYDIDSGTSPVIAYAEIYGRRLNGNWTLLDETSTQTRTMGVYEDLLFSWNNAFEIQDNYEQYRVVGYARAGGESFGQNVTAYVDDVFGGGSCSQINMIVNNLEMNEGNSQEFEFEVENNSGLDFFIEDLDLIENADFVSMDPQTGSIHVPAQDSAFVSFEAVSQQVSTDRTTSVSARIVGRFENGLNCYYPQVPAKTFSITVREGGVSQNLCAQLSLNTYSVTLPSSQTSFKSFALQNNTSRRFFVTETQVDDTGSSFDASLDFADSIINANGSGNIRVRFVTQPVSNIQTGTAHVRVRGQFENGPVCTFSEAEDKSFSVTVVNEAPPAACSAISLQGDSFELSENENQIHTFRLSNDSSRQFIIDNVRLEESNPNFAVQLLSNDSQAPAFDSAEMRIRASAGTFDFDQAGNFRIRVRGHFESGATCGYEELTSTIQVRLVQDDSGPTPSMCRDISIETTPLELLSGQTREVSFLVQNRSSQTFFINSTQVSDTSDAFSLQQTVFDSFAGPGETASFWFSAQAFSTTTQRTGTGLVRISGEFANGTTCSFSAIGNKSFPVTVISSTSGGGTTCQDFRVETPVRQTVGADNRTSVSVSFYNPTSQEAFVYPGGANLVVSPATLSIPARGRLNTTLSVQLLSESSAQLTFPVSAQGCAVETRFTSIEPFGIGAQGLELVSVPSRLSFASQGTLSFAVRNNSTRSQNVQVRLDGIPSQWTAEAPTVTVAAGETKPVLIEVFSNNAFSTQTAVLSLRSGNVQIDSESVVLESRLGLSASDVLRVTVQSVTAQQDRVRVQALVHNISNSQLSGTLSVTAPSQWQFPAPRTFILNPNVSEVVVFDIVAPSGNAPAGTATLWAVLSDGKSLETTFSLPAVPPQGGSFWDSFTGFLGLSDLGGSIGLGLLVLVLIIVGFAVLHGAYTKANPSRHRHPPFTVREKTTRWRSAQSNYTSK